MTHSIAIHLELTQDQLDQLCARSGLLRENPRRPWTIKEKKEHARQAAFRLIMRSIKS